MESTLSESCTHNNRQEKKEQAMTTLNLKHINETADSTASALLLDGEHLCYIIEDGHREVKVRGETRIPSGRYELFPRKSGGFWGRYNRRFGHDFVIGFRSVPDFKWVLIHIGNEVTETEGCLLTNTEIILGSDGNYRGSGSTSAYLMLHRLLDGLFKEGTVFIDVERAAEPEGQPTVVPPEEEPEAPTVIAPDIQEPTPTPPETGDNWSMGTIALILAIIALLLSL